jgi:ornithine cyclodeaminase/alanine dehydrogenase-like protein (mu-crystallin family)
MRIPLETPRGSLLLMAAWSEAGVGVKLVTVTPDNPAAGLPFVGGVFALFDSRTQQPVAVLDGAALTEVRTAAVSALATRHLAGPGAHRLAIVGSGVQARAHAVSMSAVRPIDDVVVVSRNGDSAAALVADLRTEGLSARVGASSDLASADVICTCTTSPDPVLRAPDLSPGVHINAVGAFTPGTRELSTDAMIAARVVVETRAAALEEAGDLLLPIGEGAFGPEHVVADLHELLGGAAVRGGPEDITVFKSVGLAFEDLVVACAIVARS